MATTQSIHMGPEWMRPQPASQTTINPPGKNPNPQPPSLGIAPNALRHAEALKTSATSTIGANAERGALGSPLTAQTVSANGSSAPGELEELLWCLSSCDCHSRVDHAGLFFGDGSPSFPILLFLYYARSSCGFAAPSVILANSTTPPPPQPSSLAQRLAGDIYHCPYNDWGVAFGYKWSTLLCF